MAGFLVSWDHAGFAPNRSRWAKAEQAALRYGGEASSQHFPHCSLMAWRRNSGEFAHSGTLNQVNQKVVAWLGQSLADKGDGTTQAIQTLAKSSFDDTAVGQINGPFAAVVVCPQPFQVRVVTDRYRHYPVYVYRASKLNVASTELRCLLPFIEHKTIDLSSVDMLLRSGELINRMTLLRGVELLPPGTLLMDSTDQPGGPVDRRYWAMRHDGAGASTLSKTAESLAERLTAAVRRIEATTPKLGITLSGGLDSRIILDLCHSPQNVPSFTWGLAGCRDIVCASRFAQVVGSHHTIQHWNPASFVPLWAKGSDLTAGSFGIESMYMLPFLPLLAANCNVVLNGLAGDAILGGNFLKQSWLAEPSIEKLGREVWRWRVTEADEQTADALVAHQTSVLPAGQRWVESMVAHQGARPVERVNDWLYENRVFRNTNSGTMLLRSAVESHAPFFDNDFIDAVTTVKQEHKFKHRLYLEVMKRAAPRAASVTWQRTNIPPKWGYHANLFAMAMHRVIGTAAPLIGITPFKDLKVADPAAWLRVPWRDAAEAILFNPAAKQRGIWDTTVAKKIWQAHLGGANHTRQIGVMISIELFARQVLDGDLP